MDLAGEVRGGLGPHASPSTRGQGAGGSEADLASDEDMIDHEEDEQGESDEDDYEEEEDDDGDADGDATEDETDDEVLEDKTAKKRARDLKNAKASAPSRDTGKKQRSGDTKNTLRGTKTASAGRVAERRRMCKQENVAAVMSGDLVVERRPLIPKILTVSNDPAVILRRPFKSPCPGASSSGSDELIRRLAGRRRFVPWGGKAWDPPKLGISCQAVPEAGEDEPKEEPAKVEEKQEEDGIEPLVLWNPEEDPAHATATSRPILVDSMLTKFLRPHQREGVQFMFECVAGLRDFHHTETTDELGCYGCILADDMGLGKTLQSITLLWTLLCSGFEGPGKPMARRAIVVTPTSLVSNWESELNKWLQGKVHVLALCEASRADVVTGISHFLAPRSNIQVLIISYETFRLHAERFKAASSCELLICDEAHRLKNDKTLTNQALACLACRRRVLLSGTPMQNDLEEFYAMVSFTNPGALGDSARFRRYFQTPILNGREPTASDDERRLGSERSAELSDKVNQVSALLYVAADALQFILRRTNALLSNHLPPKVVEIVCCKLTSLQQQLYERFIHSKNVQKLIDDNRKARVLASISSLKKLCNHPKLIYDSIRAGAAEAAGFEDCLSLFPSFLVNERNGSWNGGGGAWVDLSGKMSVLARLLSYLRTRTSDRIVLVSNYTQTLDLFAQLCRERQYPYVRLDGSTGVNKRQKLVQQFNDRSLDQFAFLLSSKAGGCGLNLIGANRLVLFDPDWNPANDKQAAARVWRDGQRKRVFVYRFLAAGTIEEKVYQRQMSKEGLQKVVDSEAGADDRAQVNLMSSEDLRDLFILHTGIGSDTHDSLSCTRCVEQTAGEVAPSQKAFKVPSAAPKPAGSQGEQEEQCLDDIGGFAEKAGVKAILSPWQKQVGSPLEEQLDKWAHHASAATVPDLAMQHAGASEVSFVFSCQVHGKLKPEESELGQMQGSTGGQLRQQGIQGLLSGGRGRPLAAQGSASLAAKPTVQRTSLLSPRPLGPARKFTPPASSPAAASSYTSLASGHRRSSTDAMVPLEKPAELSPAASKPQVQVVAMDEKENLPTYT